MTHPLFAQGTVAPAAAARLAGHPLAVMLDVDGTLAPIVPRPQDALVPNETRQVLALLTTLPGVHVVLVSGRAAFDVQRMVPVRNVWVIGNHGFEVIAPDGEEQTPAELAPVRGAVARAARRLEVLVAPVPGVTVEDKGWTMSVHYRQADEAVVPRLLDSVRQVALPLGLRVTEGKKVIEVRPPARVDKGTAVIRLGATLGAFADEASILFVGDDSTDEDAFRALRARRAGAVTVRVTHGDDETPTSAEFTLRDTAEVLAFLEWLLRQRR